MLELSVIENSIKIDNIKPRRDYFIMYVEHLAKGSVFVESEKIDIKIPASPLRVKIGGGGGGCN
jgi:hypothetical protein